MTLTYSSLSDRDRSSILDLYQRSSDYFMLSEGQIPEDCDELLYDLPPGKSAGDKVLLGIYDAEKLIGIIDCIMGFPSDRTCMIGLLLIDRQYRKMGIGQSAFDHIQALAQNQQMEVLRIGVIESNSNANHFWSKAGFRQVDIKGPMVFGNNSHMILVMEQKVQ